MCQNPASSLCRLAHIRGSRVIGQLDRSGFVSGMQAILSLSTVVGYYAYHFSGRRQLHELSRMCSLLVRVVEHYAVYTA